MNTLPERMDTNNKIINQCFGRLQASRIVNVYRPLIEITGSFDAGIFLSQLIYWYRKGVNVLDNNGFIFKTIEDIYEETGLTDYEQRHSKDILKANDANFIDTYRQQVFGKGSKTFIKLNNDTILRKLCEYYDIDVNMVGKITPENWKIGNHPVLRRLYSDRFAYHRDLVYCLGNIESAAMLSYLLNRCAVEQKVYKTLTGDDWSRVLCFSRSTQSTTRLILKELGVLEEKQLIPCNARIFSFPQFETILERLEHLAEYKENPVELPITKLAEEKRKARKSKNNNDSKNNNSLENNELPLNCEILQHRTAKFNEQDSGQNTEKSDNSLENNELPLNCEILQHRTADLRNIETQNCEILQDSIKEITFKDYSTYTTPLNPPTTISVSFGGGGGVSSQSAISAESNSGCLNDEKPATEQPNKAETATARQRIDFDSLVYPKCFYQETQGDSQREQAFKDDLRRIVASTIPFATINEVQELLDETDRANVRYMRSYFAQLCKNKSRGLFFPTLADKVKYHREESAKNIALQQQTMQLQQTQREQQQLQQQTHDVIQEYADYIEKMVCETKDANELRQKLTDEYNTQAKVIEKQLNTNVLIPVIRICVEKIATILIAYAYNFNDTISNAVELRQKIINQIGEKRLQEYEDLWNTLNIPEMQGKLSEEWNQHLLKKG